MINLILIILALIVTIPAVVFCIECLLALLPARRWPETDHSTAPQFTILMPAHNESAIIKQTLDNLIPQLRSQDSILVIADNCTDDTAQIARDAGAEVTERSHETDRGKGFALAHGLEQLKDNPPPVVIIIDADTTVEEHALTKLASRCMEHDRPMQALYLMHPPSNPSNRDLISTLAFAVKNHARPAGLDCINIPCLLTGTGMAFPYEVLSQIPLASGNIVEDMQMGLDLSLIGKSPRLCLDAKVFGQLPTQDSAATSQRTRWEHGHLQTILSQVPRMLGGGISKLNLPLIVLALDLIVPPLALLVMLMLVVTAVTGIAALLGASSLALNTTLSTFVLLILSIFVGWWVSARNMIPLKTLLTAPLYVLWKIPIYLGFLFRRQKGWVRTERDSTETL